MSDNDKVEGFRDSLSPDFYQKPHGEQLREAADYLRVQFDTDGIVRASELVAELYRSNLHATALRGASLAVIVRNRSYAVGAPLVNSNKRD